MSIILSQSLVLALSFSYDNLLARDAFTMRDIPEDNRTHDHKKTLDARARVSFGERFGEVIVKIMENHGIDAMEDSPEMHRTYDLYRIAADKLTAKRYADAKRKREERLQRERELAAERELVAELLAA